MGKERGKKKGRRVNPLKPRDGTEKVHVEILDNQNQIVVEGPPEEVTPVTQQLQSCANELVEKMHFKDITVDSKYHKHIIGKAGANIIRLKEETGVIISVQDGLPMGGPSVIHLEGPRASVQRAASAILEQVEKLEGEKERDLIIEHRFHGNLIGAKGEKIREIREQFGQVQITFPTPEEKRDVVKVRGPKEDVDKCCRHLNLVYKEMLENSYQIKVPIFSKCYEHVVGVNCVNLRKIREDNNSTYELLSLDESKGTNDVEVIVITGKKANCEKARDMLLSIQKNAANFFQSDVIISSKFHNFLMGSGGRIIQSLSKECGSVQIKFPESKSKSDQVTITGPKEDVEKAKDQLLELSCEANSYTETIEAKAQHHKFLIGKNGSNIKKIRQSIGARIIFPSNDDPHPETVTIIGKKENVMRAKKLLQDMLKDLDKVVESEMDIEPQYHRHFVHRRGEVLRHISDELGVQIFFPKVESNSSRVVLKGAAACVEEAKNCLAIIVEDLSQRITIDVIIDQKHHQTIMGSQGSKVKQIQIDYNVDIQFPERVDENNLPEENGNGIRPCDIIRVFGRDENCKAAKAALLDQVPVTIEVGVPFKMHRFVIGQSGKDLRALTKIHDVHITVPPFEQQSDTIKITGSPQNADSAKKALLNLKEDLEAKERVREAKSFEVRVQVDPKFHTKIIGKIGKIRETFDVNIQLPKRNDNLSETSDEIVIIGYEDQAKKAKEEILAIVNDLVERERYREETEIDHRVHSRIIRAKGKNVRQIMKDYGVDIRFPRANDANPNLVVISGPNEDKVLNAREHLLNLEEEYMLDIAEVGQSDQDERALMMIQDVHITDPPSEERFKDIDNLKEALDPKAKCKLCRYDPSKNRKGAKRMRKAGEKNFWVKYVEFVKREQPGLIRSRKTIICDTCRAYIRKPNSHWKDTWDKFPYTGIGNSETSGDSDSMSDPLCETDASRTAHSSEPLHSSPPHNADPQERQDSTPIKSPKRKIAKRTQETHPRERLPKPMHPPTIQTSTVSGVPKRLSAEDTYRNQQPGPSSTRRTRSHPAFTLYQAEDDSSEDEFLRPCCSSLLAKQREYRLLMDSHLEILHSRMEQLEKRVGVIEEISGVGRRQRAKKGPTFEDAKRRADLLDSRLNLLHNTNYNDNSLETSSLGTGSVQIQAEAAYSESTGVASDSQALSAASQSSRTSRPTEETPVIYMKLPTIGYTDSLCNICKDPPRNNIPLTAIDDLWITEGILLNFNARGCVHHRHNGKFTVAAKQLIKERAKPGIITVKMPQLVKFISRLSNRAICSPGLLDFSKDLSEETYQMLLGVKLSTFEKMVDSVKDQLRDTSTRSKRNAVAILLAKLRLNLSQKVLGHLFGITSQSTVSFILSRVTTLLAKHFTPKYLGFHTMTRDQAIQHNTDLAATMFELGSARVMYIMDGTYLYLQHCAHHRFQKCTYCVHKHQNLVKVMMVVGADGFIFEATPIWYSDYHHNDGKILKAMLTDPIESGSGFLHFALWNDLVFLDRGFRDAHEALKRLFLRFECPSDTDGPNVPLTAEQGFHSRKVTLIRWPVESANGWVKGKFRFFSSRIHLDYVPKLTSWFQLCCAIKNLDSPPIVQAEHRNAAIIRQCFERDGMPNQLKATLEEKGYLKGRKCWKAVTVDSAELQDVPEFSLEELEEIFLGPYQLRQGRYYVRDFRDYAVLQTDHGELPMDVLRVRMGSGLRGNTRYSAHVEFDRSKDGVKRLADYFCTCFSGARKFGGCSHIAAVLWYLSIGRHKPQSIPQDPYTDVVLDAAAILNRNPNNLEEEIVEHHEEADFNDWNLVMGNLADESNEEMQVGLEDMEEIIPVEDDFEVPSSPESEIDGLDRMFDTVLSRLRNNARDNV